ncbi:MAG: DUF6786 family protein [Polyangiales bacterium]
MRWLLLAVVAVGCATTPVSKMASSKANTFDDDVAYLRAATKVVVLESSEGGKVAVTPEWQGRVMTSAVASEARGLGFVHRAFIDGKKRGTAFDNYGGEDRFWLGPEGTKFSLYFAKGAPLDFDHWQTPHAFNEGAWQVVSSDKTHVAMKAALHLENHAGTVFDVSVDRDVQLLDRAAAKSVLGIDVPSPVQMVAFATTNTVANAGKNAWTKESGLPNVWILGMYAPSKDATVIVPFDPKAQGSIVRDDYFGKVPADRLVQHDGWLAFTCDGEYRSKIGVPPARARSVLGSYSPSARLLTIVHFEKPENAIDYPSGVWKEDTEPYAGDVVNAYNDGPVAPGKPSLGGFYELETTSPGAALGPGASMKHVHRTFHFVGDPQILSSIAKAVLGVELPLGQ